MLFDRDVVEWRRELRSPRTIQEEFTSRVTIDIPSCRVLHQSEPNRNTTHIITTTYIQSTESHHVPNASP